MAQIQRTRRKTKSGEPSRPPQESRSEPAKQTIAAAAARTIGERGFEATTLRDIAAEAQCTTGMLMHHFRDKDELLDYALGQLYEAFVREMTDVAGSQGPIDGLKALIRYLLPLDQRRKNRAKVWLNFLGRALYSPSLAVENRRRYALLGSFVTRFFSQAARSGLLREDVNIELETDMLVALAVGVGTDALLDEKRLTPARQVQMLEAYLDRLMKPHGSQKVSPQS